MYGQSVDRIPIVECYEIKVIEFAKSDKILTRIKQSYFDTEDNLHVSIKDETFFYIDENGHRDISRSVELQRSICIKSDVSTSSDALFMTLQSLEKLLMVFQGSFLNIKSIEFIDENGEECVNSKQVAEFYVTHRLNYFKTANLFQGSYAELCDWNLGSILNANTFLDWENLLSDLDIIHQIVLYNSAATGLPTEFSLAFIIESFEPLIELITQRTGLFSSLKPGQRGTTLKMCLDTVISYYGQDIFSDEYNKNSEKFTQLLTNSRVRVMHIKRNAPQSYLSGEEAILYVWKLMLLYRRVLLELLGIKYEIYSNKLKAAVDKYNSWEGIFHKFITERL